MYAIYAEKRFTSRTQKFRKLLIMLHLYFYVVNRTEGFHPDFSVREHL